MPTFNHQLRRLLVHTLLLVRVSVPLELDLMVISAKGQSMSTWEQMWNLLCLPFHRQHESLLASPLKGPSDDSAEGQWPQARRTSPMTQPEKRKNERMSFDPPGQLEVAECRPHFLQVVHIWSRQHAKLPIQMLWHFPPTLSQKPAHSSQQTGPTVLCAVALLNSTTPRLLTDGARTACTRKSTECLRRHMLSFMGQ